MRAISQVDTVLGSPGQHGQLGTAIPRGWPHPQTRVSPRGRGPSGRMIAVRASLAVVAIVVLVAACGGQKVYVQGAYNPKHLRFGPHHLGAHLVQCRIEELSEKLRGLEARGEEFALGDEDMPEPLSEEDVQALAAQVREVIAQGERRQRKALLQSFVQEIRVVSRAEIYPFFFVPAFRPPCGSVPPPRIELGHAV